jgi:hypothetical protein
VQLGVATFGTTKDFESIWNTGCVEEAVHTRYKIKRENRKKKLHKIEA